jgi:hypothetical protein
VQALLQPLSQFGQRQIGLLLQLHPQELLHRLRHPACRTMDPLRRPLHLPRLQLLPPNLLGKTVANPKLIRYLLQADLSPLVGLQNLAAQIIRICAWHRFVSARRTRQTQPTPLPPLWI